MYAVTLATLIQKQFPVLSPSFPDVFISGEKSFNHQKHKFPDEGE
jgi:hypothetical protein